jgi:hypothetical protein
MINELCNEKIVLEIKALLDDVEKVKDDINIYCDLMKQIFLSGSAKN